MTVYIGCNMNELPFNIKMCLRLRGEERFISRKGGLFLLSEWSRNQRSLFYKKNERPYHPIYWPTISDVFEIVGELYEHCCINELVSKNHSYSYVIVSEALEWVDKDRDEAIGNFRDYVAYYYKFHKANYFYDEFELFDRDLTDDELYRLKHWKPKDDTPEILAELREKKKQYLNRVARYF